MHIMKLFCVFLAIRHFPKFPILIQVFARKIIRMVFQ